MGKNHIVCVHSLNLSYHLSEVLILRLYITGVNIFPYHVYFVTVYESFIQILYIQLSLLTEYILLNFQIVCCFFSELFVMLSTAKILFLPRTAV